MIFEGCQSKAKEITIEERKCPNCGHEVEIFSVDTEVKCPNCGFTVYNDKLSCVQWCKYAKQCVGEQRYNQLMKVAQMQKARREAEKKAREEEKKRQEAGKSVG